MGSLSSALIWRAIGYGVGLVLIVIAVLVGRSIAKRRIAAAVATPRPFAFGTRMDPVPGTSLSFDVDVAGLPGVVSVARFVEPPAIRSLDPMAQVMQRAARAWMDQPPGRVHVKVPLGPEWPSLSILFRAGGQQVGTALARSIGTAGTEIPTGDAAFDAQYRIASGTPDPRPALTVVNPQVRQMILQGRVQRWVSSTGMWIETGFMDPAQEAAAVDWTIRLATLIVTSSGIPVIRPGPPPVVPGGQVPA